MRPGRLDRILSVGPPDLEGRVEILRIRTQKMSVEEGLDLEQIARMVCVITPYRAALPLIAFLCTTTDGRMLWSRDHGALPGGCSADHEREY